MRPTRRSLFPHFILLHTYFADNTSNRFPIIPYNNIKTWRFFYQSWNGNRVFFSSRSMKITRRDRLCGQGLRIVIGGASIVHFLGQDEKRARIVCLSRWTDKAR